MPNWIKERSPKECGYGDGWVNELDRAWREGYKYAVMSRKIKTAWGEIEHVCIRNADNTDIPWAEKQRIKNELFGKEVLAIEVFPAESRLIDQAGMYHLWVFPEGAELPFGLHDDDMKTVHVARAIGG
ncbi:MULTISPECIES: hypothetical protein [unclassified Dehalobacter]|uniref:DUF7694 domain-containing protein n=1 Tax=unclassified Dehalobacter TaxID=2635733 RepID=UPI001043F15C|nr:MULTISPECIES: hypothetical protein [unclassified Dehalobacter]TCX51947.1 hypothetical protein C1I36_06415 [Dehalobacter sp. 14DCB1]TCX53007.1 hypothetical protein C1I38_08095 [Dehalobacter sp. 12DCB1]